MKVYVKKGNLKSIVPGLIITLVFGISSIGIFTVFFLRFNGVFTFDNFIVIISSIGIALLFAIVLFSCAVYFSFLLLKKPKKYSAYLSDKIIETYRGQEINSMTFIIRNEKQSNTQMIHKCYTKEPSALQVGQNYTVGIKEFHWKIKHVDHLNNAASNANKLSTVTLFPVFLGIEFIFGTGALFMVTKIIFDSQHGKNNLFLNIIPLIICLGFCILGYTVYKQWKVDNSDERYKKYIGLRELQLKKINVLRPSDKKIPNLMVKQVLSRGIFILVLWYGLLFFIFIISGSFNNLADLILPISLPAIIVEAINLLMIIPCIRKDNRIIKKNHINITVQNNIAAINSFSIIRPTHNMISEKFFIIDSNNNLLYKIQSYGLIGVKYIISDQHDNQIGEIDRKLLSLNAEYLVIIVNKKPYYIRQNMSSYCNYELIGSDYMVLGDFGSISSAICNKNKDVMATIVARQKNEKCFELGNSNVEVNPEFENNENLVFIALCVTIGNLYIERRKHNSA